MSKKIKEFINRFNAISENEHEDYPHSMADVLELAGDLCNQFNFNSNDIETAIKSGVNDEFGVLHILHGETVELENEETNRKSAMGRKNLYESDETEEIYYDLLLLDMKRDFGEFTDIKMKDFRFITEWLKNKISDKKIIG